MNEGSAHNRLAAIRPDAWTLDPNIAFLNHGSFGACPRVVLERQWRIRAEMEREPVEFLVRKTPPLVDRSRAALAYNYPAQYKRLAEALRRMGVCGTQGK